MNHILKLLIAILFLISNINSEDKINVLISNDLLNMINFASTNLLINKLKFPYNLKNVKLNINDTLLLIKLNLKLSNIIIENLEIDKLLTKTTEKDGLTRVSLLIKNIKTNFDCNLKYIFHNPFIFKLFVELKDLEIKIVQKENGIYIDYINFKDLDATSDKFFFRMLAKILSFFQFITRLIIKGKVKKADAFIESMFNNNINLIQDEKEKKEFFVKIPKEIITTLENNEFKIKIPVILSNDGLKKKIKNLISKKF